MPDRICQNQSTLSYHILGILVLGGDGVPDSMEYYFPRSPEQNRVLEQKMITARYGHASVLMADGRVLTAGGWHRGNRGCLSSTEMFEPESGRVMHGPNMSTTREWPAAALLGQDVYIAGGWNSDSGCLSSCERLRSGEWTPIASMNEKRRWSAMVAIDGKLFIFGGLNGGRFPSSVECYDPERDRWEIVTQMPTARRSFAAAELNGSIYVCGGWNEREWDRLSVCECYDYGKCEWETMASMKKKRKDFSLVAANGRLYALGVDQWRKSIEMYNPDRNEWTVLPNELVEGRVGYSAVVL